jgi:spore coat polysaccharide biosynthesis predicted glycosyltransferase SpsG
LSTNRASILFRCDASPDTGYESFFQCFTLAAALQRRRRGTHFFSLLNPPSLAQQIHRANNDWQASADPVAAPGDLLATLREIYRLNAGAVIVAARNVPSDYLAALRETGVLVVAIDTVSAYDQPASLVINPLLAPDRSMYRGARPDCEFLIGRRYTLVRPMFRRARTLRTQEPMQPFRGIVALGDDDPLGHSLERCEQLLASSRVGKVDVMVRPIHPQLPSLRALAEQSGGRLEVAVEPSEITSRLSRAHFAITSGDGWSVEMACVGIPQLIITQQPDHVLNAQRLEEIGAASYLGDAASVSAGVLRNAVNGLLSDSIERGCMMRSGRKHIDARGPDRLVNGIEIMMQQSRQKVVLPTAA